MKFIITVLNLWFFLSYLFILLFSEPSVLLMKRPSKYYDGIKWKILIFG